MAKRKSAKGQTMVSKTYTNYTSVQNVYHSKKMQLSSFSEITYVQLTTMAELLSQHKIASIHPVRYLNTIEVIKSDLLTQTPGHVF
jgi:hypothetical protein